MSERDGYIPGVPCWVDTNQPDPAKAAEFYGGLFGWQLEESMPDGAEGSYLTATIRGGPVGAISSVPEGAPASPAWTTHISVDDADAKIGRASCGERVGKDVEIPVAAGNIK